MSVLLFEHLGLGQVVDPESQAGILQDVNLLVDQLEGLEVQRLLACFGLGEKLDHGLEVDEHVVEVDVCDTEGLARDVELLRLQAMQIDIILSSSVGFVECADALKNFLARLVLELFKLPRNEEFIFLLYWVEAAEPLFNILEYYVLIRTLFHLDLHSQVLFFLGRAA